MARTTTRARRPALLKRAIHESTGSAGLRVDRDAGVIFGVKVIGRSSPNSHGVRNVTGTDYTDEALSGALGLYEGRLVNCDHPPRERPGKERSVYDRLGKLVGARVTADGIYADLHLLKTHPMAERLMEAAEAMPECFGLSHNAMGEGEVRGDRYVITRIPEVRSVDVVADAGTTRSLFESHEPRRGRKTMKKTLREALTEIGVPAKTCKLLWEMGDMLKPDMAADDMPPPPEPDGDEAEDEGYETHLGRMIVAILNDESLDNEAKKKKVLAATNLLDAGQEAPPEPEEKPVEEADEEGEEEDDEAKKEKAVKESLQRKVDQLERKDAVRDLCESLQFIPTGPQLKALVGLDAESDRKSLIESLKGAKKAAPAPRSSPGVRPVSESREPAKTKEEFVKALLS